MMLYSRRSFSPPASLKLKLVKTVDMKVENSENGVSSSLPIKLSPSPKVSASDENGRNYERMGVGLSNQKKVVMKGYMSPTASASSKAIAQRKIILTERNENSEWINPKPQVQTVSAFDPNCSYRVHRVHSGSLSYEDSEFGRSKESSMNNELSSDPYDPLTNYLSPRPNFLRYKPDRSREIFLRQENKLGGEKYDGRMEKVDSFDPPTLSDEHPVLCSSELVSENEQEEEDMEEHEEEIEESDEEFEDTEEEKGLTLNGVSKFLALLIAIIVSAPYFSSMNTNSISSHGFQSIEVLRNGSCDVQNNESGFITELRYESDFWGGLTDEKEQGLEVVHQGTSEWIEEVKMADDMLQNNQLNQIFHQQEVNELGALEENQIHIYTDFEDERRLTDVEFTNQLLEVEELKSRESEIRGFESGGNDAEVDLGEGEELEFENMVEKLQFSADVSTTNSEKMVGSDLSLFSLVQILKEKNYMENRMKNQSFFQVLMGFLAFLVILVVSVVSYRLKKKKKATGKQQLLRVEALEENEENTSKKSASLTMKTSSESVIIEEDEPLNKTYYSKAPTIELLGEFVVGEASGMKNRMIESKDSNYLVSTEEYSARKAHSRPALSELSNSPSYGSFTAEKKIVNKEVDRDGDLRATPTPVRRSSRIKNRASMTTP